MGHSGCRQDGLFSHTLSLRRVVCELGRCATSALTATINTHRSRRRHIYSRTLSIIRRPNPIPDIRKTKWLERGVLAARFTLQQASGVGYSTQAKKRGSRQKSLLGLPALHARCAMLAVEEHDRGKADNPLFGQNTRTAVNLLSPTVFRRCSNEWVTYPGQGRGAWGGGMIEDD